jgi:glycosyltransferase involved in cell wall biosynthesis
MAGRGLRRRRRPNAIVPDFVRRAPIGVNVAGYLTTESGLGEAARLMIRSLEEAAIPVALNNVPSRLRMGDTSVSAFTTDNPQPFNLVHLNADNMEWFAQGQGRRYFRDRYTIGFWFWELSEFRSDWTPAFDYVDEVWAATEFGRTTIARRSPVPVVCMPLPVVAPPESPYGRAHFRLAEDAFVFLFTFDVSSQMARKNPLGVISAFRRAFPTRRDAVLVLKFTNAEYDRAAVRQLYEAAQAADAMLLGGYMTRDELSGLMQCADCYVSLHRSEGFGIGIAEAMALGKPVIATAYSGNADVMTPDNSYPVDYRIVAIDRDYGPYLRGYRWAEPDLDQAAALMRHVVENRDEAAARGHRAASEMAAARTPALTGARVRRRLDQIRSGQRFDLGLLDSLSSDARGL